MTLSFFRVAMRLATATALTAAGWALCADCYGSINAARALMVLSLGSYVWATSP